MIALLIICFVALAKSSNVCVLTKDLQSCVSSDKIAIYPGDDPSANSGHGIQFNIALSSGAGCGLSKNVSYEISVPTHFDYCNSGYEKPTAVCNSQYTFTTRANTTFFLSSILPLNTESQVVTSKVFVDEIETGCEIKASMNPLWVSNCPATCTLE